VLAHEADDFEAIHFRHENVDDQQVEVFTLDRLDTSSPTLDQNCAVSLMLQHEIEGCTKGWIVIDNQYVCHGPSLVRRDAETIFGQLC